MDFTFKPVVNWPGPPTRGRRRALFSAGYMQTLELLDRELRHLSARRIVIQTYHSESDIRLDGKPRAGARVPSNPGVILSFESKHGPLSYPCDTFTKWDDNLRAIALALECLRTVDRYGVTKRGEQYRGWKALPEASNNNSDKIEAANFLAGHSDCYAGRILESKDTFESAYKQAARKLHPDVGGSHGEFVALQEAAEVLRLHHSIS